MFVPPISKAVTKGISNSIQKIPEPQVGRVAVSGLRIFFLLVLIPVSLCAWLARADAQEPAPRFDDLASRAGAARESENLPLAIELYGKGVQLKPDWAEGWFYLGLLNYSSDSFPAAIDAFNHLLLLQPGAVPALALRGLSEYETGAYDDALRDLEPAVTKGAANQPHNAMILRFHLAQLLTRSGRFQDALAQYQFFASQHVKDPDFLVGLALAGMRVSSLTKDVSAADRELYQAAGSAGYALLAGDTQEGDGMFAQLFTRYPTTPNLHFFYGFLLFPHSPELAIEQFRSEVFTTPANVEAHAMLGFTLMIAGRYAEAQPEAELVLAKAPEMEMAQLALGRSLAEIGDVKRGTELLNQVLQGDPDNLEAHLGLASIYSRTGRREDAYREHMVCRSLAK